jgi:hypothetical protein
MIVVHQKTYKKVVDGFGILDDRIERIGGSEVVSASMMKQIEGNVWSVVVGPPTYVLTNRGMWMFEGEKLLDRHYVLGSFDKLFATEYIFVVRLQSVMRCKLATFAHTHTYDFPAIITSAAVGGGRVAVGLNNGDTYLFVGELAYQFGNRIAARIQYLKLTAKFMWICNSQGGIAQYNIVVPYEFVRAIDIGESVISGVSEADDGIWIAGTSTIQFFHFKLGFTRVVTVWGENLSLIDNFVIWRSGGSGSLSVNGVQVGLMKEFRNGDYMLLNPKQRGIYVTLAWVLKQFGILGKDVLVLIFRELLDMGV